MIQLCRPVFDPLNPRFVPAPGRRDHPFRSPPRRTTTHTVWILRKGSSVIIPHLLSMTAVNAASHKSPLFQCLGCGRRARAPCEKACGVIRTTHFALADSRIMPRSRRWPRVGGWPFPVRAGFPTMNRPDAKNGGAIHARLGLRDRPGSTRRPHSIVVLPILSSVIFFDGQASVSR